MVDDAIVVLENIERWLEKGLPVREATIKAMQEITGPIVAITLVLSSVLLPSAFLSGITGQFFRQFALTISVTMLISAINAMTLTPARAAWIFAHRKPVTHGAVEGQPPAGGDDKEAPAVVELYPVRWVGDCVTAERRSSGWLELPVEGEPGVTGSSPGNLAASLRAWGCYLALFLPGDVAGGVLGKFTIRPVNWVLGGSVSAASTRVFERATQVYGTTVSWFLRLSAPCANCLCRG